VCDQVSAYSFLHLSLAPDLVMVGGVVDLLGLPFFEIQYFME
jgi:hypothetical protein